MISKTLRDSISSLPAREARQTFWRGVLPAFLILLLFPILDFPLLLLPGLAFPTLLITILSYLILRWEARAAARGE